MTPGLEALGRRAVACRRWRWMPGMRAAWRERGVVGQTVRRTDQRMPDDYDEANWIAWVDRMRAIPDFSDPATLGCLQALVRESRSDPHLAAAPWSGIWRIGHRVAATEAEVWIATLEGAE